MDELTLQKEELDILRDIDDAYRKSKALFIRTEEQLSAMKFFPAPLVEHRAALDHLMRYFRYKQDADKTPKRCREELENARSHELRAYFDVADYACIIIRDEINTALKHLSKRRINKIWDDYVSTRKRVIDVSKKIAEIRDKRTESMDKIKEYESILDELFRIYEFFQTSIQPKIGGSLF